MKGKPRLCLSPTPRAGGAGHALAVPVLVSWALLLGASGVLCAAATPAPEKVPPKAPPAKGLERVDTGQFWLLDFQCIAVRPAVIADAGGGAEGDVFWYLIYTVENRDTVDHVYKLTFTATSDKGRSYSCMVLPDVERRAEEGERRALQGPADLWEAEKARREGDASKYGIATTLKAGEKRWCVATFNRIDAEADKIEILVRGLTNEFRVTVLEDGGRRVTEKALKLLLERPGDEFGHGLDAFKYLGREWTTHSVEIPASGA